MRSCARDVGSNTWKLTYVSCTWTHCASPLLCSYFRDALQKKSKRILPKKSKTVAHKKSKKTCKRNPKRCCKRNPGSLCAVAGPAPRILSRSAAHPRLTHGRLLANMNILFNISKDQQNRKCTKTTKLQMNFTNKKDWDDSLETSLYLHPIM